MYFVKTPYWIKRLFPNIIWELPNSNNSIYLSFDDGPNPATTKYILDTLKQYHAKATFFCLGKNVEQYPSLTQLIVDEGHLIANHGYEHLNGWKIDNQTYLDNIRKGEEIIKQFSKSDKLLFRPPYGKFKQIKHPTSVVNYSIMCGDFDSKISSEQCLKNITNNITSGSIICMHDNDKAKQKMEYVLPKLLTQLKDKKNNIETLSL